MFTGHLPELIILAVVALVVFGPKRLPEIGGALGKSIKDFKKGVADLDVETHATALPQPAEHTTPVAAETSPAPKIS